MSDTQGQALLNDPVRNKATAVHAGRAPPARTGGAIAANGGGASTGSQTDILETEVTTATRVAEFMFDNGLAQVERPRDIRAWIEDQLYKPRY
jgi:malate dehydrogenase (oxaloacetate-decarboxylating)(NADP+)